MKGQVLKATDLFTRAEIRDLTRSSDLRGALSVATDWGLVAASLAAVAALPHPLVVLAALVVIGGRQLGLAVLMHECAHRSLFRTRWLNDVVGTWLCAAPVWTDLARYRAHHLAHHARTGVEGDPDLGLVDPFPASRGSIVRKLLRDVSGVTAVRRVAGLLLMDLGLLSYTASTGAHRLDPPMPLAGARNAVRHLGPVVLANAVLLGFLAAAGHPALYLVWVGAWCTTYSLVLRVRSIAEHACTEATADPFRNTRTVPPRWPLRAIVAPHHVGYHLEHHLLVTVPHWRLVEVHRRLAERGLLGPHNTAPGYAAVLRHAVSATSDIYT